MMKRNILAVVIPALLVAGAANAAEIYNKNGNKLDFYGKMVGEHVWTTNGDTNSSDTTYARIGLKGETQINDQLTGYGQWEYNMDASNVEGSQGTKTRLAFAGLKAGEYGSFDYGRNYGAIYDVESATDMLVEWGGDGWNYTDNFMTGRTNGVATYRNSDFFGLVDGLSFALQYQGKNDSSRAIQKQNGDGVSTSATYAFDNGIALSAGYASSNRSVAQKADGNGDKAEAWATSAKYDANNIYAAVMYSQTYNMTPETRRTTSLAKLRTSKPLLSISSTSVCVRPSATFRLKVKTCRVVPVSPAAMLTWLNTSKWVPGTTSTRT
ncbi:hypothetical protein ROGSH02058M1_033720 [Raoultella ornithinolytica]|nr:hypothetical protein ROGSH02058M1_033720 [Raoultella ornithinolytica]BBT86111.1 hypothetical protein WP8W19C01_33520 [Raoultella ornithinolytica]